MKSKKDVFLGIIHYHQVITPSPQDILNDFTLEDEVKEAFTKFKQKGDVEKILKKIAQKHKQKFVTEEVFVTDAMHHKQFVESSLIINIDTKELIKNRYIDDEPEKIVSNYIKKYQAKIDKFNAIYKK